MEPISLAEFYRATGKLMPESLTKEIGHFNVFEISEVHKFKRKTGATAKRKKPQR